MSSLFVPQVGAVMSADIAVPEHARELAFYERVLKTGAAPLWGEHGMNNLGLPIVGLGARTADLERLPLQWMPHIQVADVAASAQRAVELGGIELMHQRDAAGASQWAVLSDPNGAAFGIIPVVEAASIPTAAREASTDTPVGRIAWLDLTVPDAEATRDFYREVVGWTVQDVPMEDAGEPYVDYAMLGADGMGIGGVCHARGVNAGLPPVWMLYLTVGDIDESLRRVAGEGGSVMKTMPADDGTPPYAVIGDPLGVCIGLMQA